MAKPIFLIGVPYSDMSILEIEHFENSVEKIITDYHVLYRQSLYWDFQVLNAADLTELQFEELKQMVKDSIK